jgi:hypothetical protein
LPGLFAKEVALFGGPVLLAALWVKDRTVTLSGLARAAVPLVMVVALYWIARGAVLGPAHLPAVPPVEGTGPQILTSVAIVAIYVGLLLVPVGLSARYDIREVPGADWIFITGLVIPGALAVGRRAARTRRPGSCRCRPSPPRCCRFAGWILGSIVAGGSSSSGGAPRSGSLLPGV